MSKEPAVSESVVISRDKLLAARVAASIEHLRQYTGCLSELSATGVGQTYYVESGSLIDVARHKDMETSVFIATCQQCADEPHCCVDEASIDDWFEADNSRQKALETSLEVGALF